jgi:hypothetical protein
VSSTKGTTRAEERTLDPVNKVVDPLFNTFDKEDAGISAQKMSSD